MEPIPPEVQAHGARQGATPFDNTPRQPAAHPHDGPQDDALPFRAPPAQGHNGISHVAGVSAIAAKNPPRQLSSPGVLSGLSGFRAHPSARSVSAGAAVAAPMPDVGGTGQMQAQPVAAEASVEPPTVQTPPRVESSGDPSGESPPADVPSADGAPAPGGAPARAGPPAGEHPLAATNSPWTQTADGTAPPVLLPAADVLPSAQAVAAAPEPKEEAIIAPIESSSGSSRTLMTVGLAIAAIALIALIAYFMTASGDVSDDPTSVGGVEQRDYGDDPAPKPTSSATANPAPRPYVPAPAPNPPSGDIYEQKDKPAPAPAEDIYDDL